LGNGDGTFQPHVDYRSALVPLSITVSDFNGDGQLDMAIANTASCTPSGCVNGQSVSILMGKGDGTFQPHVDYVTGTNPNAVTAGDLNGDGKVDLAVANSSDSTISILAGRGDGTFFQRPAGHATGTQPMFVTASDFNGDGKLDLATANFASRTVSILLGNGD